MLLIFPTPLTTGIVISLYMYDHHSSSKLKRSGQSNRVTQRIELHHFAKFREIGQTVFEILQFVIFQDGGCCHLEFQKFLNFISWLGLEGRDASSCRISSESINPLQRHCKFWFFKMATVCHLGFVWGICGPPANGTFGGLYDCAKFGYDRCSSFDNMKVSIFCAFGLKTPIHAQK